MGKVVKVSGPLVVATGKEGSLGMGMANIKKSVERAVGADIL